MNRLKVKKTYKEIGGYFELEIPKSSANNVLLRSGRAAFQFILSKLNPEHVMLPYFACEVLRVTLDHVGISYELYALDENLEIKNEIKSDATYLYINYFGLKRDYSASLSEALGNKLILDNTHDLFWPSLKTNLSPSFNSLRKFIGVPDGAEVIMDDEKRQDMCQLEHSRESHLEHLVTRLEASAQAGYQAYVKNEATFDHTIKRSSAISEQIFDAIDRKNISQRRRSNYLKLHNHLAMSNALSRNVLELKKDHVPFSYPYLPKNELKHEQLWNQNIFAPRLWPECNDFENFSYESNLAQKTIHLPIDHRYDNGDMQYLIEVINHHGK